MSVYVIDYSDPLKTGFTIPAGGFNGPGGSSSNTSLRLYGRGALEWGEAVDEDLLRLAENFASASPPSNPIAGQLWAERSLYYRDTTSPAPYQGWWYYDLDETTSTKWKLINLTGIVAGGSIDPGTAAAGQYYYNTTAGVLKGFFSLGKYEPIAWLPRSSFEGAGNPNTTVPVTIPKIQLRIYDGAAGVWTTPAASYVNITSPDNPQIGQLWYNTTTSQLSVWNGTTWEAIFGPGGGATATGDLDMGIHQIHNVLAGDANSTDAVNVIQMETAIAGINRFLLLTGGTLTGPGNLNVGGTFKVTGTSTFNGSTTHTQPTAFTTISTSSTATLSSLSVTNAASVGTTLGVGGAFTGSSTGSFGGQLNMNLNKVINVATGTNNNDAVNVAQMNTAISAASTAETTPTIFFTSGSYKAGDICIVSGKVYIAVGAGSGVAPGGNWKQVYPAVYA